MLIERKIVPCKDDKKTYIIEADITLEDNSDAMRFYTRLELKYRVIHEGEYPIIYPTFKKKKEAEKYFNSIESIARIINPDYNESNKETTLKYLTLVNDEIV